MFSDDKDLNRSYVPRIEQRSITSSLMRWFSIRMSISDHLNVSLSPKYLFWIRLRSVHRSSLLPLLYYLDSQAYVSKTVHPLPDSCLLSWSTVGHSGGWWLLMPIYCVFIILVILGWQLNLDGVVVKVMWSWWDAITKEWACGKGNAILLSKVFTAYSIYLYWQFCHLKVDSIGPFTSPQFTWRTSPSIQFNSKLAR